MACLIAENATERAARRRLEQLVDLLRARFAFQLKYAVGKAGVKDRRTYRVPIELALQLRINQRDSGGAAGRRRLERQHGGAGAPQILVRGIDDDVGVSWCVDRRDLAVANADRLLHYLDDWCQAVSRARRSCQQAMARGIVQAVIHADDHIECALIFHRRRDDDALHAAIEIGLQLLGLEELARAFQHDLASKITPRHLTGSSSSRETDAPAGHADSALAVASDGLVPSAVEAVEFQQMRTRRGAAFDLVDMGDLEPVAGAGIVLRPGKSAHGGAQS